MTLDGLSNIFESRHANPFPDQRPLRVAYVAAGVAIYGEEGQGRHPQHGFGVDGQPSPAHGVLRCQQGIRFLPIRGFGKLCAARLCECDLASWRNHATFQFSTLHNYYNTSP